MSSPGAGAAFSPAASPAAMATPPQWHGAASDALRILLSSLQVGISLVPTPLWMHTFLDADILCACTEVCIL